MCMPGGGIINVGNWNWDGDRIVHDCIVPKTRPVVGRTGRDAFYDIDVREFLLGDRNAMLRRAVDEEIPLMLKQHRGAHVERYKGNGPGSFDYRASVVSQFVANQVHYLPVGDTIDAWQFPDETLHLKGGDCEDRAILLAALMIASGVSPYNVRVALGKVYLDRYDGTSKEHDHAWVVYKTEANRWTVVDPPVHAKDASKVGARRKTKPKRRALRSTRYVPWYVFNDAHLWEIGPSSRRPFREVALRRKWKRMHPRFHGDVHHTIVDNALSQANAPQWVIDDVNRHFFSVFGQTIDAPDNFTQHAYDSFDHFDNAYIDESWARVQERLSQFRSDNHANLDAFAWAAHGIADFYAHSSYGHFAKEDGDRLITFDHDDPGACLDQQPDYSQSGFDLGNGEFSVNSAWTGNKSQVPGLWSGRLISGRYCQHGDSHDMLERLTPSPSYLDNPGRRMTMPHHNEIAVDEDKPDDAHILYSGKTYADQFARREKTAIEHIRKVFAENWQA
jgi:hypothetical protein